MSIERRYQILDTAEIMIVIGIIHDIKEKSKEDYTANQLQKTEERLCKLIGIDTEGNQLKIKEDE